MILSKAIRVLGSLSWQLHQELRKPVQDRWATRSFSIGEEEAQAILVVSRWLHAAQAKDNFDTDKGVENGN